MTEHSVINLLNSSKDYFHKNKGKYNNDYIEEVLENLENYDIVSFDIFDTILTRLVECPIDIFSIVEQYLIESKYPAEGFAIARFESEKIARDSAYKAGKEEITLENIYEQISSLYPKYDDFLDEAKRIEIFIEVNYCVPSIDNLFLINKIIEKNKKIILVSDMYLDKKTIIQMLNKINVTSFDNLYLSSELFATKNHGSIWEKVLTDYNDKKILHIGDNNDSDIVIPKKYGIDTILFSFLKTERRLGGQLSPNIIPFSLIKKMIMLTDKKLSEDFWLSFGVSFGSFYIYSFLQWLSLEAKKNKIQHIYFCSRDAYLIYKLWKEFDFDKVCNISSSYLYISRLVLGYTQCYIECKNNNKLSEESLSFLSNHNIISGQTNREVLTRLKININDIDLKKFIARFGELDNEFNFSYLDDFKYYLGNDLLPFLLPQFEEHYNNSYAYYKQEGIFEEKKLAIVDLGWSGSLQHALTLIRENDGIKEKISGFYYGLHNGSATGRIFYNGVMKAAFFSEFNDDNILMRNSINILENLHYANHESVIGFKREIDTFRPIFKEEKEFLKQQAKNLNKFYQGVHIAISKWMNNEEVFGLASNYVNINSSRGALAQVLCSPNKLELNELGHILHAPGYDHQTYFPLIWFSNEPWNNNISIMMNRGGWLCGQLSYWKNEGYYSNDANLYHFINETLTNYPKILKEFLLG